MHTEQKFMSSLIKTVVKSQTHVRPLPLAISQWHEAMMYKDQEITAVFCGNHSLKEIKFKQGFVQ